MKVPLCDIMFTWFYKIITTSKEYAFALAHVLRCDYERFSSALVKLFFEALQICWQQPCLREELVFLWIILLHT